MAEAGSPVEAPPGAQPRLGGLTVRVRAGGELGEDAVGERNISDARRPSTANEAAGGA
ncbi:hypothetical protein ABTW95_23705 [Spirillospora sp. NPDC127506]|jgi:hypothetical protein